MPLYTVNNPGPDTPLQAGQPVSVDVTLDATQLQDRLESKGSQAYLIGVMANFRNTGDTGGTGYPTTGAVMLDPFAGSATHFQKNLTPSVNNSKLILWLLIAVPDSKAEFNVGPATDAQMPS